MNIIRFRAYVFWILSEKVDFLPFLFFFFSSFRTRKVRYYYYSSGFSCSVFRPFVRALILNENRIRTLSWGICLLVCLFACLSDARIVDSLSSLRRMHLRDELRVYAFKMQLQIVSEKSNLRRHLLKFISRQW